MKMITKTLLLLSLVLWRTTTTFCQGYSFVPSTGKVFINTGWSQSFSSSSSSSSSSLYTRRKCGGLVMKIRIGIIGLPNVGKSSLFNALAKKSIAQSANFPFCTIEPNVAPVPVPDPYLNELGEFANSRRLVSATMEWVDVAGLVKGASRGEGLGNRFLATVRECNVICHLIRCYDDPDVIHVDGRVDPLADAEVVNLELLLADLAHVGRRLEKASCKDTEREVLEKVETGLEKGIPARAIGLTEEEKFIIKSMGLLTLKPVVYTFNVDEVDFMFDRDGTFSRLKNDMKLLQYSDPETQQYAIVSAKFEAEISSKSKNEQVDYLSSLDLEPHESVESLLCYNVLPCLVQKLLGLSLFYTGPGVSPQRSRTTKSYLNSNGLNAFDVAGRLHGEIERGFICAEVANAEILLKHEGFFAAKEAGCIRTEGKSYAIQPNDVVFIKWV